MLVRISHAKPSIPRSHLLEAEGPQHELDPFKGHIDAVSLRLLIVGQEVRLHQPKVDLVHILAPAVLWKDLNMPCPSVSASCRAFYQASAACAEQNHDVATDRFSGVQ